MFATIDKISDVCGRIAAWLFFVVGLLITYEVVARYVFISPTPWAEEISQFLQIWATYLAAAFVLHNRDLIVIEFFVIRMPPRLRRVSDTIGLLVIVAFCVVAVIYGSAIVAESVAQNRHTSTMMGVPRWMTEMAIPLGCGLLVLQALVELFRVWGVRCPRVGGAK
ncbi:MAG: TRAP transporter small permease [Rhodospirillaceae bacterium]|nr:TRAP transporter small permease [Rhodospirillaceae bacterium]